MELVAGLYTTIALIVFILHEYVNENIGYGARVHFDFWLDVILEIIFVGFWIITPIAAINADRVTDINLFSWILNVAPVVEISVAIGIAVILVFTIGWWLFPIILSNEADYGKINLLNKLPPVERRLGVNIYRAGFIVRNSKKTEKDTTPEWYDKKDSPEEEIFIGKKPLKVIETEEEAAAFLESVEKEKKSYSYLYIDEYSTPLQVVLYKMNKARNRAIARVITITVLIIVLFFVLRAHYS